MAEYASHGVGTAGLTTGIIGTGLGVLNGMNNGNGLLGGLFGNGNRQGCGCGNGYGYGYGYGFGGDPYGHLINRYEAGQQARIAELETEVKLRDANIYTDQKLADLNAHYERRLNGIEAQIAQQAVYNATNNGMIGCMRQQIEQLQGLTKMVVPISSICPAPMLQYNSWVAPTATAETPATGT